MISIDEAKNLKLQLITYFKIKFALDEAIHKKTNVNLGTTEKPELVNCNIKKPRRHYDHFKWIKELVKEINKDPDRIAHIVQNAKGERAIGVNQID